MNDPRDGFLNDDQLEENGAKLISQIGELPAWMRMGIGMGCLYTASAIPDMDPDSKGRMVLLASCALEKLEQHQKDTVAIILSGWTCRSGLDPSKIPELSKALTDLQDKEIAELARKRGEKGKR